MDEKNIVADFSFFRCNQWQGNEKSFRSQNFSINCKKKKFSCYVNETIHQSFGIISTIQLSGWNEVKLLCYNVANLPELHCVDVDHAMDDEVDMFQ
jgi:hypothetical protein